MNKIMRNSNEYSGFSNAASEQTFAPGNSGLSSTNTENAIKEVAGLVGNGKLQNITNIVATSEGLTVTWTDTNGSHVDLIEWYVAPTPSE